MNDLLSRFVDDRDALSDDELKALARLLRDHADVRRTLSRQLQMDKLLDCALDEKSDFEGRIRYALEQMGRNDDERFVARTLQTVRANRAPRRPIPRRCRSVPIRTRTARSSFARLGLVAAGVVLVFALIMILSNRRESKKELPAATAHIPLVTFSGDIVCKPGLQRQRASLPSRFTVRRGRLLLIYPDGSRVAAKEGTVLRLLARAGKQIALEQGRLHVQAAPQPVSAPMQIHMGETSATVVGTVFEVSYEKAEVRLEVREGKVRLRRGNNSLLVPAGYFATAGPRQPLRLHAIDRQDAPAIAGDGNQAYFSLVSAASARPVAYGERLPENARIPLAQLPHGPLNILYHPPAALAGKIEYVNFRVAGPEELVTTEENAPYAVFGNPPAAAKHKTSLVLNPWRPQRGRYTIQVTPWIRDKGRIIRGPSRRIQLIFE